MGRGVSVCVFVPFFNSIVTVSLVHFIRNLRQCSVSRLLTIQRHAVESNRRSARERTTQKCFT